MAFTVSTEELVSFHSIDRELFSRLVYHLGRDSNLAMWVVGLWLFLEEQGFSSIILTLRSLPDNVVISVFQEAVTVLNFLQAGNPPSSQTREINVIPRTYHIMGPYYTLQFLHETRADILNGVVKTVNQVCIRAFGDIFPQGMDQGNVGRTLGLYQPLQAVEPTNGVAMVGKLHIPILPYIPHSFHPGFRTLLRFRGYGPMIFPSVQGQFEVGESSNNQTFNPRSNDYERTQDRTLFLTFARGYTVSEEELLDFFRRNYGNVIEQIHMEETGAGVEPLWAYVVFRSSGIVAQIMNGHEKIKFVINGKFVWARRIVQLRRG